MFEVLCQFAVMKVLAVILLVTVASALGERAWERIHGDNKTPRIVGGTEVVPHSVPWQVALDLNAPDGTYFCGGSLLSPDIVLTAAHCCELTNNITVTLGAHNINNLTEPTQQKIEASRTTIHPSWDSAQLLNDICLITLLKNATLNDAVQPGTLPTRSQASDNFADRVATATGWGLDSDQATQISPVLREVSATIVTNLRCRTLFGILGLLIPLHESNICIDGTGGKSTCNGDSGGPLVVPDNVGNKIIVGLTSFGSSAGCEQGYPAVFTRTSSFLDWISLESGIIILP